MLSMGFSFNLLTLLAMVLAIGLVVDDAIVVVENVYRHIEEGEPPFRAAIIGAREIVGPVIAMTITLAAVYAPIGFLAGLSGALFKEFAFTLAGAVIISGIIALTLSPMMASRLSPRRRRKAGSRARSTGSSPPPRASTAAVSPARSTTGPWCCCSRSVSCSSSATCSSRPRRNWRRRKTRASSSRCRRGRNTPTSITPRPTARTCSPPTTRFLRPTPPS